MRTHRLTRSCLLLGLALVTMAISALAQSGTPADHVALSRDGGIAATSHMTATGLVVVVHEMANGTALRRITPLGNEVDALHVSADGKHVLVVASTVPDFESVLKPVQTAQLFSTATGNEERRWARHNSGGQWCLFTNDSRSVVVAGMDSTLILWDLATGTQARAFTGFNDSINAIALSDDDAYLIAGGNDETARIYRIGSEAPVQTLRVRKGPVLTVAISRDTQFTFTGSRERTLTLWRTASGEHVSDLELASAVWSVALSPNNAFLAVGTSRNLIVMSMTEGKTKWMETTEEPVKNILFSEDSKFLASRDQWAHVYESATGTSQLEKQGLHLWAAQFSRQAPRVLYSYGSGAFLHDLQADKRLVTLSD